MIQDARIHERRSTHLHQCVLLILLPFASAAAAQGSPPYLTDDPGTPGPKRWEIHLGVTLEKRPGEYLLETPDIDINYGIGKRFQLNFETSWNTAGVRGRTESGPGNSHFGIKWRFLDRRSAPLAVSIFPQFDFNPASTREFGLLDRDIELELPVEMETHPGSFIVVAEVGYNLVFTETDAFKYGVIVARPVGRVNIGAEIHGESDIDLSDDELIINLGAIIDLNRRQSLMASVGVGPRGASSEDPRFMAYLGIQLRM